MLTTVTTAARATTAATTYPITAVESPAGVSSAGASAEAYVSSTSLTGLFVPKSSISPFYSRTTILISPFVVSTSFISTVLPV